MAGSASCDPVGHLHNSQRRRRWRRSSSTVGNQWQRRRALQARSDTAKPSCKAPSLFLLPYWCIYVMMEVQTHNWAVPSLTAPWVFFFPVTSLIWKSLSIKCSTVCCPHCLQQRFSCIVRLSLCHPPAGASLSPCVSAHEALCFHFLHSQLIASFFFFFFLIVDNVCIPFK